MPTRAPGTAGTVVVAMAIGIPATTTTGITATTTGIMPHTTGMGTSTASIPVFMGGYSTTYPRYGLLPRPTLA